MDARKKKFLIILAVVGALACAGALAAWRLGLGEQAARCLELVRKEGAGVFFAAMAILPLFGFPLAPFVLSAGPVFAPELGAGVVIACGVAALAANVSIGYAVAGHVMRPWLEKLLAWLGYRPPPVLRHKSWEATLLLRVVPGVPFCLQNIMLGLARVRFGVYLPVSVAVPTIHLTLAVLAGDALAKGDGRKIVVVAAAIVVAGTALYLLRRRLEAVKRANQAKTGAAP